MMHKITLADHLEIARVIRAADPTYRKRDAYVYARDMVTLGGTYWDGGSRSTYTAVALDSGRTSAAEQFAPPQFGDPRVAPTVTLPDGIVIVKTGIFCGKTATAAVYVRPDNMPRMLPAA